MKLVRCLVVSLSVMFLAAPLLRAEDFSKYRGFALGSSLATILKQTDQKLSDVSVPLGGPALFQEVSWWPPNLTGSLFRSDSVERILFSFYDGTLYKLTVTYDQTSTEGLTAEDMTKSIAAKYGPATKIAPAMSVGPSAETVEKDQMESKAKIIATWEDAQNSFNLVRASFTERFGLEIYSKAGKAQAEVALAAAAKAYKNDGPEREAEREKKVADDLEVARQKNQKTFHP